MIRFYNAPAQALSYAVTGTAPGRETMELVWELEREIKKLRTENHRIQTEKQLWSLTAKLFWFCWMTTVVGFILAIGG